MTIFSKHGGRFRCGALTLDLSAAKLPGVARLDLNGVRLAYFQVRSGDQGSALGYCDAEGHFVTIALFADRAAADQALAAVRRGLTGCCAWSLRGIFMGLGVVAGGLLALVLVLSLINALTAPAPRVSVPSPAVLQGGVPGDADLRFGGK